MKLLLVGATGLVGRHVLDLALGSAAIDAVVAPGRRVPTAGHDKLLAPIIDFEELPADAPWWGADAVICTLGTTMRAAGSKPAFRRVDHDYPLAIARAAHRKGTPTFVLTSAIGANVASFVFYKRVKGELERELAGIGFRSLTFVRPGLIGGERAEVRWGERLASVVLQVLHPVLPRRWRINPAPRIAQVLLEAALESAPGVHVVTSDALA